MAALDIDGNKVRSLWERRGVSSSELSRLTGINPGRLNEIVETGHGNIGELEKIASKLLLTLTDVLVGEEPYQLPTTDFRTLGSKEPAMTPKLAHAIETISARIEFLDDEELAPRLDLPWISNSTAKRDPAAAAEVLRHWLGFADYRANRNRAGPTYLAWKTRIESKGVIVSQAPLGGAARGLSLFAFNCAAIVIDSEEKHEGAKLFSLLHELAHVLRRESAISDQSWSKKTERWCNQFAAHAIMPASRLEAFLARTELKPRLDSDFIGSIRKIANAFGASLQAVSYHLDALGYTQDASKRYSNWFSAQGFKLESESDEADNGSSGGPETHFYSKINDYGTAYISAIDAGLRRGTISRYEAADALGVKYKYVDGLIERSSSRLKRYGDQ